MSDRTGQIWLVGFKPYQYAALVAGSEGASRSLTVHTFVRLDADPPRPFDVPESVHHPLEERSDMQRVA